MGTSSKCPNLKTLYLDDVQFQGNNGNVGFVKLLSGCPVLEYLVMQDMKWYEWDDCSVSSNTLKRLKFYWDIYDIEDREERPNSVSFDTPNLLRIEYTDAIADMYPTLKFDSLAGATLCLQMRVGEQEDS